MKKFTISILALVGLICPIRSVASAESNSLTPELKSYLQKYLYNPSESESFRKSVKVVVRWVPLKSSSEKEVIAFVSGEGWCGADGGCHLLMLETNGNSFKPIGEVPKVELPIKLATKLTNCHPDIIAKVGAGGGVPHSYEVELKFDGRSYPDSVFDKHVKAVGYKAGESFSAIISNGEDGEFVFPQ